ncbi:MAG: FAS1-like dehydratase domain-containing protein [Oscillochloridaceae bacterium umkhey_bin13]
MIDQANLGRRFGPYQVTVERAHIQAMATTLGSTDPLHHDPAAAQAAGWPDLVAPPTLPTRYGLWANPPLLAELATLGAPLPRLLHGEQVYQYMAPIVAGDTLTSQPTIVGLERKQGQSGPFELLTLETRWHNQRGEQVLVDRLVVVVRGEEAA